MKRTLSLAITFLALISCKSRSFNSTEVSANSDDLLVRPPAAAPELKERKRMEVIAHRGAKAVQPENTLRAFRHAIQLKVEALEFDIQMTRDDKIVVIHDPTVDRTTNGKGAVSDYTFE